MGVVCPLYMYAFGVRFRVLTARCGVSDGRFHYTETLSLSFSLGYRYLSLPQAAQ